MRRTARGRIWASTRSRRWVASSSASRSSTAGSARIRHIRSSGVEASTPRSSRAVRSSRAIRLAACCKASAGRFRERRSRSRSRSCARSSSGRARATRTFPRRSALPSRASRSRSRKMPRSWRPCGGMPRLSSAPSRARSACRSGPTRRSSPTAGIPTVLFGPRGEGAHAEVEWVDVGDLERCVEIYVAVASELCS